MAGDSHHTSISARIKNLILAGIIPLVKAYSINNFDNSGKVLEIYGISQNPDTKDYIMVLQYAEGGNFNDWINNNQKYFNWTNKLKVLCNIISGLKEIHQKKMVHCDFHIGNILFKDIHWISSNYISDMGLCGKVGNVDKTNLYGVMPYVSPEVLRRKPYTQAADIYSFGMVMYFVATKRQPFADYAHDEVLALDICKGIRPEINEAEAPKCYIDLMKRCWDSNPDKRPSAIEIEELIRLFYNSYCSTNTRREGIEIEKQFKEAEMFRTTIKNSQLIIHTQAVYTSRLLNSFTKDLAEYTNDNTECLDCEI
ncbi:kinase-like domain-containing protein [Rhizophagus irregularis DAOM 181602=DAOM 197198]|uniref:Kinase-like domain-containing protein n=3 Tax=Rhizophagus irregularis TaxID=588596 RepID=U9UXG4_RHIID|nr:kinase-like domain-containing protein [Rhizophagus irregularis DAOM 181602=DAOM 197198]EXX67767.1 Cmk1p [Rhizophagus irregularis DAOM 197198w]POG76768.1 kinase-like domain-containing protein [Rhizophagus irregularis DAOM 181602=DAOM 197198]GBC42875.1 kinase-like domain-containing protein [Rhizophagus irregularis DAOM 181602=DAOM 197198]|eukprot:XP_025183634.1 kinase-like domain-containing protein [Rhizophagus irregularis DAOM 181602=DAOM 197198]